MNNGSDVVIVGGGAAGCSVAYYLAQAGVRSTIIERQGIGSQASGYSAGGLNPLQGTGIPGPLSEVAMESYLMHQDLWPVLKAATGVDYEWRIISMIKAAFDEADIPELLDTGEIFTAADGFEASFLDREQVLDLEPRIAPDVLQAVVARGNASLDSHKYTLALAQAAEKLGATIRPGTVRGLEHSNGRVTGVQPRLRVPGPWPRSQNYLAAGEHPVIQLYAGHPVVGMLQAPHRTRTDCGPQLFRGLRQSLSVLKSNLGRFCLVP